MYLCPICNNEVKIEKVAENSGMDGWYYDWHITCPNCHMLEVRYSADNFYNRKYYETSHAALEAFGEHVKKFKK